MEHELFRVAFYAESSRAIPIRGLSCWRVWWLSRCHFELVHEAARQQFRISCSGSVTLKEYKVGLLCRQIADSARGLEQLWRTVIGQIKSIRSRIWVVRFIAVQADLAAIAKKVQAVGDKPDRRSGRT